MLAPRPLFTTQAGWPPLTNQAAHVCEWPGSLAFLIHREYVYGEVEEACHER